MLFFRTPSIGLPYKNTIFPPTDPLSKAALAEDSLELQEKKRRSHRKYPPLHSNLRLPDMRVQLGEGNVLKAQGMEFVELMRKSVMRDNGEGKIELVERQGWGLWTDEQMYEVGKWFGERLRS